MLLGGVISLVRSSVLRDPLEVFGHSDFCLADAMWVTYLENKHAEFFNE